MEIQAINAFGLAISFNYESFDLLIGFILIRINV
jgi:hypothetical protein